VSIAASLSLVPIVLADGSGTRLWPLSRSLHPKQYLSLSVGKTKETLLQEGVWRTVQLADATFAVQRPCVVANEEHREPLGRNTAPALTLGALDATKSEFRSPYPDAMNSAVRRAVIFDGQSILYPRKARAAGFEYTGIGRP